MSDEIFLEARNQNCRNKYLTNLDNRFRRVYPNMKGRVEFRKIRIEKKIDSIFTDRPMNEYINNKSPFP